MYRATLDQSSAKRRTGARRQRIGAKEADSVPGLAIMGDDPVKFAVDLTNMALGCAGKFHGIRQKRIQHRLDLSRRGCDHAKHLASRRLLLQRLGKITVAFL